MTKEKERLTKRGPITQSDIDCLMEFSDDNQFGRNDAYFKLQHYENLAEDGKLLEQPYKPGAWVYCIEGDDDDAEVSGYLFFATCGDYVIVGVEYFHHHEHFESQLEEMAEESQLDDVDVRIFHKSKVFLSSEEAAAALNEFEK